jgi:hypothetical protein
VSRSNRSIFPQKVLVTSGFGEISSLSLLPPKRVLRAQTNDKDDGVHAVSEQV